MYTCIHFKFRKCQNGTFIDGGSKKIELLYVNWNMIIIITMVTEKKTLIRAKQSSFIITNQYRPSDEVQNVHVPCKTYDRKLLHFIQTNVLKTNKI